MENIFYFSAQPKKKKQKQKRNARNTILRKTENQSQT